MSQVKCTDVSVISLHSIETQVLQSNDMLYYIIRQNDINRQMWEISVGGDVGRNICYITIIRPTVTVQKGVKSAYLEKCGNILYQKFRLSPSL